jgi:hypothetical protein
MKCVKVVVNINCKHCQGAAIKFGKVGGKQRLLLQKMSKDSITCLPKYCVQHFHRFKYSSARERKLRYKKHCETIECFRKYSSKRIRQIAGKLKKPLVSICAGL